MFYSFYSGTKSFETGNICPFQKTENFGKRNNKVFQSVNIPYSEKDPDIAIVIGGDGTFGYYGRILRIPMLFVGINDPDILGSKAKLAGISYDYLARALISIKSGRCFVDKRRMFSLNYGTEKSVDNEDIDRVMWVDASSMKVNIPEDHLF